jgi:hypothetical protein
MISPNAHDTALEEQPETDALSEVFDRAMRRFNDTVPPQLEMRQQSLMARRFCDIPGAQWEGEWGEQWANTIRVEVNKISRGVEKIETDYRENRIVPDFRPAGGQSDQDTADMLDGLHRADSYHFKAQQARDNAFFEAIRGGFGAYRLTNELEDPYDKDNDYQRINPGMTIVDADQCVFFDLNSKLYDKSDARFAWVVTAYTMDAFRDEFGEDSATSWPDATYRLQYDWFTPDMVRVAEYYEKEDRTETLLVFTQKLTGIEERLWLSDIEPDYIAEQQAKGWTVTRKRRKRCRVHKYVMTGAQIVKDCGYIAGDRIPVVPVYGKRYFIDNMERWKGHVQDRMDAQRLYNSNVSKLAETNSLAPREMPIFLAEQMPPHLAEQWANQNIERHPYALVDPVIDNDGNYVATGPIGKIEPPQLAPVQAALLQIANQDLTELDNDGAGEVRANVSAEAMDIAAARVDAKSGVYLDNMRQSVECEAEIYLSMARDVYFEPGRKVETMTEDGDDGEAILQEMIADKTGTIRIRNDLQRGKYKVVASVTEATATRRDKTVKSSLNMAEIALQAGDQELAQASIITAVMNSDGEGINQLQAFARRKGIAIGLVEPNEEEQAAMDAAAESEQPDPAALAVEAQANALNAQAAKDMATTEKTMADTELSRAKTAETEAETLVKLAEVGRIGTETEMAQFRPLPRLEPR